MNPEPKLCKRCGADIPAARLKALPETKVCVECSEQIGGEKRMVVRVGSTGKAGSLKKTGQEVSVTFEEKYDR